MQDLHHVYCLSSVTKEDDVAVVRQAPHGLAQLGSWPAQASRKLGEFQYPRFNGAYKPFPSPIVAGLFQQMAGYRP